MKTKMKKIFVDATKYQEVQMLLLGKKIGFTTQKFMFDMPTVAVLAGGAIVAFFLGALIF